MAVNDKARENALRSSLFSFARNDEDRERETEEQLRDREEPAPARERESAPSAKTETRPAREPDRPAPVKKKRSVPDPELPKKKIGRPRLEDYPRESYKGQELTRKGTIRVGFWLSAEVDSALDEEKKRTGMDKSAIAEKVLRKHFGFK